MFSIMDIKDQTNIQVQTGTTFGQVRQNSSGQDHSLRSRTTDLSTLQQVDVHVLYNIHN